MRTVSGGEATLLAQGHVNHHLRVYVKNASGTAKLLTSLGGTNWVDAVAWDGESVDRQIATATLSLRRDVQGGTSLAPLIEGSSLNVDDASAYAPLLNVGREVWIETAIVAPGGTPGAGDWKEVFRGRIDDIDWQSDPLSVQCSDLGAWLMDTAIQEPRTYGSDSGASIESILQDILDDWSPFGSPVTLYELNSSGVATAVGGGGALSPGWTIPKSFTQQPMPVLEALNNIVAQVGWTLRYHYDTAGTLAFTLYEPPRSSTTALATISPSVYRDVRKCAQALREVRNDFALDYLDTSGVAQTATDSDAGSIAAFGARFMRLAGDAVANIRTSTDAGTMLAAVKADLAAPKLDHEVTLYYWWPAQAYDVLTFPANGVHYDTDQKLAVVSVRHEASGGEILTTLQVRGSVIGAFAEWLAKRIVSPLSGDGSSLVSISWFAVSDTPTTRAGYGITDVPKTDGTDATGTWGINISGSAATAASATVAGSATGNAGTATKLATARNINGVAFDGSADVTVPAAAGTLTGGTLASGVTASSLTSVGTLTSLTVSGRATFTTGFSNGFRIFDGSSGRWAGGQAALVAGDSSADVQVASFNYGFNSITNTTTGATALALIGYGDVVSIVAQIAGTAGSEFVTGAPAAGQTQLKMSSGLTYIRSGSSRSGNTYGMITLTGANA